MKLWYVSRDGKRHVYVDPRTGSTEWTRKLGEEIGEKRLRHPGIEQVELEDEIEAIHWWRRKGCSSRRRSGS
jgi:hypothetical protein